MSASDEEYKKQLIERYVAGEASEKELQAFFGLLTEAEIDSLIEEHMDQEILRLREEQHLLTPVKKLKLWKYAAVVSGLLLISYGGYYIIQSSKKTQQIAQNQIHDITPGGNKAVLTLANGTKISLTDAKIGAIANRGNVAVDKKSDGEVVYNLLQPGTRNPRAQIKYDTLTIPRAGQYHLTMADGSKIWLNAATQIRYPESFAGKERKIELIYGEVDIDVKHNAAMPFKVLVKGQTIEDIGTNFNINAYDDEPSVKTTLLEGSAKVSKGNQKVILKTGQQSATQVGNNSITVKEVDPESAIDWKNGEFDLKHESLASIMRKVSRWYDVKIVYSPNVNNNVTYSGSVSRYGNVSKVLESLETTGDTKFKIEGKQITVIK